MQLILRDAPAVGLHLSEGGLRIHRPLLDGQVDPPGRLSKAVRHRPAKYHAMATAASSATPRPVSCMTPRLTCAATSPCATAVGSC